MLISFLMEQWFAIVLYLSFDKQCYASFYYLIEQWFSIVLPIYLAGYWCLRVGNEKEEEKEKRKREGRREEEKRDIPHSSSCQLADMSCTVSQQASADSLTTILQDFLLRYNYSCRFRV